MLQRASLPPVQRMTTMGPFAPDGHDHLDAEQVAAFLDGGLSPADRLAAESHLAACAPCRAELAQVRALAASAPAPSRRRRLPVPVRGALAAAAVLAAVAIGLPLLTPSPDDPLLRADRQGEGVATIEPYTSNAGVVAAGNALFAWRPVAGNSSYRFTLTDEVGDVVLQEVTADTLLRLDTLRLPAGALYWRVDALLPDGQVATTRMQRIEVRD